VIETILDARCTGCGICVSVCPTDVLGLSAGGIAVIARPEDCQTCFQCELYCPEDAVFVHPGAAARGKAAPAADIRAHIGQYRRESGWGPWAEDPAYRNQHWRMEDVFRRARDL